MALKLYSHPLASFCWKSLIALYENGTPFEAVMIDLGDPQTKAKFQAMWPSAKIPLLEDDGRIVPETTIMIEYLDRRHPGKIVLLPRDPEEALEARLWDRMFDFYVMDPMQRFIGQQLRPQAERDTRTLAETLAALASAYDTIEKKFQGRIWAANESFGIADCAAAPALFYAAIVAPFPSSHTNLASYFERLMARPSVRRVIREARPYFKFFPFNHAIPARFLTDNADAS
jgi:glutathione S-transferase